MLSSSLVTQLIEHIDSINIRLHNHTAPLDLRIPSKSDLVAIKEESKLGRKYLDYGQVVSASPTSAHIETQEGNVISRPLKNLIMIATAKEIDRRPLLELEGIPSPSRFPIPDSPFSVYAPYNSDDVYFASYCYLTELEPFKSAPFGLCEVAQVSIPEKDSLLY